MTKTSEQSLEALSYNDYHDCKVSKPVATPTNSYCTLQLWLQVRVSTSFGSELAWSCMQVSKIHVAIIVLIRYVRRLHA